MYLKLALSEFSIFEFQVRAFNFMLSNSAVSIFNFDCFIRERRSNRNIFPKHCLFLKFKFHQKFLTMLVNFCGKLRANTATISQGSDYYTTE